MLGSECLIYILEVLAVDHLINDTLHNFFTKYYGQNHVSTVVDEVGFVVFRSVWRRCLNPQRCKCLIYVLEALAMDHRINDTLHNLPNKIYYGQSSG